MLVVETYIHSAGLKGIGLFAKTRISKGSKFWLRNESFDMLFSDSDLETLPEIVLAFIKKHGEQEATGKWYLCGDNSRFINHSKHPNSVSFFNEFGQAEYYEATKDIEVGDEILCDYTQSCLSCKDGLDFDPID